MKPGADTASAEIITTARLGSHAPKISRNAKTFVGLTIPEISRPAPNTNPDNKDATISMILASEDMTGYCDGYNRCQHKDDGRSDEAEYEEADEDDGKDDCVRHRDVPPRLKALLDLQPGLHVGQIAFDALDNDLRSLSDGDIVETASAKGSLLVAMYKN